MATLGGAISRPRTPNLFTLTARRVFAATKMAAEGLSGSVLTVAGFGCVDVGAFQANIVAGWVVTGLTVLLLDWVRE